MELRVINGDDRERTIGTIFISSLFGKEKLNEKEKR
jgi:hypothetical protein